MSWRLRHLPGVLRMLPAGTPGKTRIARILLGSRLGRRDLLVNGRHGRFMVPSAHEAIGFHLLVDGVYEARSVRFVLDRLRPRSTFADIGANIGVFTVPAARKVGTEGRVLAIEASPTIVRYLKENVSLNALANVRVKHCAATDRNAEAVCFYEAPVDHFGMGALAAQFASCATPVPARRLDRILREEGIEQVDVVKVDVEGYEAAVFRGAELLLTSRVPPIILFEFCDWAEARVPGGKAGDSQRVLREYGYTIERLSDVMGRRAPLKEILVDGYEMLVGTRQRR